MFLMQTTCNCKYQHLMTTNAKMYSADLIQIKQPISMGFRMIFFWSRYNDTSSSPLKVVYLPLVAQMASIRFLLGGYSEGTNPN